MNTEEKQQIISSLLGMFPNYNQHFNLFMNLTDLDLTKSQIKALLIIAHAEPFLSMGELAEKMCISREQASRVINPLADRNLINRRIHPGNRRQIDISLSESGKTCLESLQESYSRAMLTALDKLTPEELQEFLSSIKIVIHTLEKILV